MLRQKPNQSSDIVQLYSDCIENEPKQRIWFFQLILYIYLYGMDTFVFCIYQDFLFLKTVILLYLYGLLAVSKHFRRKHKMDTLYICLAIGKWVFTL